MTKKLDKSVERVTNPNFVDKMNFLLEGGNRHDDKNSRSDVKI